MAQQPPPYSQQGYPQGFPQAYPQQGYPPQGYPPQGFAQPQPYPPNYGNYGGPPQGGYGAFQSSGMMAGHQGMAGAFRSAAMGGYDSDVEGGGGGGPGMENAFSDKAVRRNFIRKVYAILSVQLVITSAIILMFMFIQPLKFYAIQNRWLYWVAFALTFGCMIALACCESVRRTFPTNFAVLGVFTICEGILLGSITVYFEADAVLIAAGATAAVTLALTVFAFQSKWDFTACGGMLCGMLVILIFAGILMAIFPYNKYAMIGYGSAGALIFSMYIVYDTQLMMGGNHKYSISPEEYIFAALNIYVDIVNLFLYILTIVGAARSD